MNEMMGVLANPLNNALTPTLLPQTTHTYSDRHGDLVGHAELRHVDVVHHVDRDGQEPDRRDQGRDETLQAQVPITPTYTQPLNNPAWDFIYATRTGNTCDMTLSNNVLGAARLYVEGNFCLSNNSSIQISSMVVRGNVDISNNGQIGSTSSMNTRVEAYVGGSCRYGGGSWATPCSGNQDSRHIYSKRDGPNWTVGVNSTTRSSPVRRRTSRSGTHGPSPGRRPTARA